MTPIFTVDGIAYNVSVPTGGLKRLGKVLDGKNTEMAKSGRMIRDIIGTYYNYSMQVDTSGMDVAAYDALYEMLSAPVDYHVIAMPYGQGTITFDAYVTDLSDELILMEDGENLWGNLTFNFVAMAPRRR